MNNIMKNKITNGIVKWREKNQFNVALLIEYPPQIHSIHLDPLRVMLGAQINFLLSRS